MPQTHEVQIWPPWDSHEPLPYFNSTQTDIQWQLVEFYRFKKYEQGWGHTLEEISRSRDGWLDDSLAGKDDVLFAHGTSSINVCVDWPGYPRFNRAVSTVVAFFAFVQQTNMQVRGPGSYHRYSVPGMSAPLRRPDALPDIWGHLKKREGEVIITRLIKLRGPVQDWLVEIYVPVPYIEWIQRPGGTWRNAFRT